MSTRATIRIKERVYLTDADIEQNKLTEREILLYHHSDGYPSGVGTDLKEFLKDRRDFADGRWNAERIATDLVRGAIKHKAYDSDEEKPDMGYECAIAPHGDSAYGYAIDCDENTLTCYDLDWDQMDWADATTVEIPDRQTL